MKQFVLKNRLLVLTYICIISFIAGCGETTSPRIEVIPGQTEESFSAEYYILKKPERGDFKELEKLTRSKNSAIAAEAENILGYYYFSRENNPDKAIETFIRNYSAFGATKYIKTMNELWRMDIHLSSGDYIPATVWAKRVEKKLNDPQTALALKTYCEQHNLAIENEDYFTCVSYRLGAYVTVYEYNEPYIEVTPSRQLNVLVQTKEKQNGGVLYYFTQVMDAEARKNIKIKMSDQYEPGDWDFTIDVDKGHLAGSGYDLQFGPDVPYSLENMNTYVELENCQRVLIGVSNTSIDSAAKLKEELLENKVEVKILNTSSNMVPAIRAVLDEWDEQKFCAVAAGSEDDVSYFIPTVRQYITNPNIQRVFIIQSVDTGAHYSRNYLQYYTGSYLFPVIDLVFDADVKAFANDYKNTLGKDLTYDALIGYDMMHFIYRLTEYGRYDQTPYKTGIISFTGDSVTRKIRGYLMNKGGKVSELEIVQPQPEFGIGYDETETDEVVY